jgi:hypothetical protein
MCPDCCAIAHHQLRASVKMPTADVVRAHRDQRPANRFH